MALFTAIAGVKRTTNVLHDSLSIADELNNRNTAQFDLKIAASEAWVPSTGDSVVIQRGTYDTSAGVPSPTFTRASTAYDPYTGAEVAAGVPRYPTVGGTTGVQVEQGCTNLLTANQSSIETDLTGFSTYQACVLTRTTADFWQGNACLSAGVNYARSAGNEGVVIDTTTELAANTEYTFSFWAKETNYSGGPMRVMYYDGGSSVLASMTFTPSNTWERYTLTFTTNTTPGSYKLYIDTNNDPTVVATVLFDGLQVEQSAYATSWQLGGTPRAAESLTIPTAGVLSPSAGAVCLMMAFIGAGELFNTTMGRPYVFFDHATATNDANIIRLERDTSGVWTAYTGDDTGAYTPSQSAAIAAQPGLNIVTLAGDTASLDVWLNGTKIATAASPKMFSVLASVLNLGNYDAIFSTSAQINTGIVGVRIGTAKPPDAELAAITPATGLPASITGQTYAADYNGTLEPIRGTTVFAGSIETTEGEPYSENSAIQETRWVVTCTDNNQIADRHLVAAVYDTANQTLSDIVTDIVATALAGEGITTTNVQTGPTITKAIFNYATAASAFNDLAQLTGFSWWIDYNKDLHFCARDANAAPFAVSDTAKNARKWKLASQRSQYRNRQFVRAGTDVTPSRTETFVGDGHSKAFTLVYAVAKVPTSITVTTGGVTTPKTIGIKGVDSGKDFYWNVGSNTITQDDTGTVLTSSDVLSVTYQGQFPIIVDSQDDAQIASMKASEGGTGVYEAIVDEPNVNSSDMAIADAKGYITKYGTIPQTVTFETDTDGLSAGQLIPIANSLLGLSGDWLIDKVTAKDVNGKFLRYTVECLSGQHLGGWVEFFRALVENGQTYVIRDNEVVTFLRTFVETVALTDSVTYTAAAPVTTVGSALVGYSEVA